MEQQAGFSGVTKQQADTPPSLSPTPSQGKKKKSLETANVGQTLTPSSSTKIIFQVLNKKKNPCHPSRGKNKKPWKVKNSSLARLTVIVLYEKSPLVMWNDIAWAPQAPHALHRKEADTHLFKSHFLSALLISEIKQATPLWHNRARWSHCVWGESCSLASYLSHEHFILRWNTRKLPAALNVPLFLNDSFSREEASSTIPSPRTDEGFRVSLT